MITKLLYLRAALYTDRIEAIRVTTELEEQCKADEGYISFVTDASAMPVVGQARMIWLSPEGAAIRPFLTAFMGNEPLTYIVSGASCESSLLAQARDVTAEVLADVRARMKEVAPALQDDHDALIYVECDDWREYERPIDATPAIWTNVIAALQLEGRGYDWKRPAAIANVIGIPAGTLELSSEDIIVGLPHDGSLGKLEVPDVVRDLLTLKLLLHSWAPEKKKQFVARRGDKDFRSILDARRDWLFRSATLRAELRAVESYSNVERYLNRTTVSPIAIPQAKLDMHFLQHLSGRLIDMFASLRERLAFEDDLSNAELVQVRHEYDFRLAEENIRLQRSVRWLTWIMLIMTAVLLFDSDALRTGVGILAQESVRLLTR